MQESPYNRALIFSGGGTRFATYCGMFAAMEENGLKPDLIIATCGGAIAATIINSFGTNEERKAYLRSEELYEYIRATKLTKEKMLYRIGLDCLKMMRSKGRASRIENIFDKYIVDMPTEIGPLLPSLSPEFGMNVPSIIVGSRVLFPKSDAGKQRNNIKLYRKVIFTDEETSRRIDHDKIRIGSDNYRDSAVDPEIEFEAGISMLTAMRISVSDMFYVQPVYYNNCYYAGGAIDLVPVELAQAVANLVILEKKRGYNRMEESLVRAVFGFSGNDRLREIKDAPVYWIDTSDVIPALNGHYIRKQIDWLKLQVKISLPGSFRKFTEDMEIQWHYGYEKIKHTFIK